MIGDISAVCAAIDKYKKELANSTKWVLANQTLYKLCEDLG